jgi:hypothetical protein
MPEPVKPLNWIPQRVSSLTHHLPAALMVTAVVYFLHHDLHLLDAVDGYAFLAIGNLAAGSVSEEHGNDPMVGVVLIDQKSNEDYYAERSPLDRCQLKNDLKAIYDLVPPPKLLVVDLDLSPVVPEPRVDVAAIARNERAALCDNELLKLLMRHGTTDTVLMAPFKMLNLDARDSVASWRHTLGKAVAFAQDPTISVRYGMVNDVECKPDSLAATAYQRYPGTTGKEDNCFRHLASAEPLTISPGHYYSKLRLVSVSELPTRQGPSQRRAAPVATALALPVIFIGTSFGDDDTFLTPLGTIYGVEVHAAAFTSLLYPTTIGQVLGFCADIGIALGMGGLIAWSWRRYFNKRFSSSAFDRQAAPWVILVFVVVLLALIGGLTYLSYWALRHCNIWVSPIPIAVGMLFESFFNSAVSAAVGEGYEQRQALIRRLQDAHASGPDAFARRVTQEVSQRPRHVHSLKDRAQRFWCTDFRGLLAGGHRGALALLVVRRVFFLALLSWLLWAVFMEPLKSIIEAMP